MYRIGIDIDDTITNTTEKIMEYSKKLKMDDAINGLDFVNLNVDNLEDYRPFLEKYIEEVLGSCTIKENVVEVINKLKSMGNKIYFITARNNKYSGNIENITARFLEKNNIPYDELLFDYEDKRQICLDNKIDYMIDDNIDVYNSLIDTTTKPILFSKELNDSYDAFRVSNWLEVFKLFGGE